jgi:hypothetical protein
MAGLLTESLSPTVWSESTSPSRAEPGFYSELFGWRSTNVDMGPMGTYAMFEQPPATNVGNIVRVNAGGWEGLPPQWAVYVQVENVDDRAQKASELGGTICVPPFDIPNVGRACVVLDPEGASFYLFAPLSAER